MMRPFYDRPSALPEADRAIEWALGHPDTPAWMRTALAEALSSDPIDVSIQANLLKTLLDRRVTAWLAAAYASIAEPAVHDRPRPDDNP